MGEILPDGSIRTSENGYEGYCPICKKIIRTNMNGNEIGKHDCILLNSEPSVQESDTSKAS